MTSHLPNEQQKPSCVSPGRFVESAVARERIAAAQRYVSKMGPDQLAWLYRKPYQQAQGQALFPELYSVLNSLQVLQVKQGEHVLEVGSGPGWVTELLVLLGVNVTCVEPAVDMVSIARERLAATIAHHRIASPPAVTFLQDSLEEADVPKAAFDGVLFHESLHHVIDERACIAKSFESLKAGGRLVVCEWSWAPGDAALEKTLVHEMEQFGTMESPFTQAYLDSLLTEAGFVDITRYHLINGFIPQSQGDKTIASMAQGPANRTNNLRAMRPFECPTSRDPGAVDPGAVAVSVGDVVWTRDGRVVRLNVAISNRSSAVLLGAGLGSITLSLCTGRLGAPSFKEAGRVPLGRNVPPASTAQISTEYVIPIGHTDASWRVELVAEGVVWLDLHAKPQVRFGSNDDTPKGP